MQKTLLRLASLCLLLAVSSPALVRAQTAEKTSPAPKPSLYERPGGVYSIATVVDDFIERLLVNDTLNANPAIKEARARVPKAGLKFRVTAHVCQVTGGPDVYKGRSMKEAHATCTSRKRSGTRWWRIS